MQYLNFKTPMEVKFLGETGVFEGYASVFHVTDSANDQIIPGAFQTSLGQFKDENRLPPLLWQHNAEEPIGAWREMYEDSHGLYVRGELFINDITLAKEAYKLMRENVVTGLSIGYRTKKSYRDTDTGVRVLAEVELLEVSMVTFPANDHARINNVKKICAGGVPPSEREFEAFLREAGLSRKQAKGVIAQGYKAISAPPRDVPEDDIVTAIQKLTQKIRQLTY